MGFKSDLYKDLAHMFVAGLIGAYMAGRRTNDKAKWWLWMAIGLSIAEVTAFVYFRYFQ